MCFKELTLKKKKISITSINYEKKRVVSFLLCLFTQPTWVQIFRPVKIPDYGSETDGGEKKFAI